MKSIVVLLSLFYPCQGQGYGCPSGWTRTKDRCYYISGNYDTFEGANKYCRDRKSHLDPSLLCETHVLLVEVLTSYRSKCPKGENCDEFWIGIKNLNSELWNTGNDLMIRRRHQCQHWAKGYPLGNGTCGIVSLRGTWKKGTWKNVNCASTFKYACISCPNNFDYLPEINECVNFNLNVANWSDAQKNCSNMKRGARLVSIQDSRKQKAVVDYINIQLRREKETHVCYSLKSEHQGRVMWLGGQTKIPNVCTTPFVWKQLGAPDIPFAYTNWFPGRPNCAAGTESCVLITPVYFSSYPWGDAPCHVPLCYLCEF